MIAAIQGVTVDFVAECATLKPMPPQRRENTIEKMYRNILTPKKRKESVNTATTHQTKAVAKSQWYFL